MFTSLMLFRLYFLIVAVVIIAPTFSKLVTKRIAHEYGFDPDISFMLQATMITYNKTMLLLFATTGISFFALMLRFWERPYWVTVGR